MPARSLGIAFLLASSLIVSARPVAAEEENITRSVLQVIRLKPGEQRFIEVALPQGDFRPAGKGGRADFTAAFFPERRKGEFARILQDKPAPGEHFNAARYPLAAGLTLRWSENKSGIEFEASQEAQPTTKDVRVTYSDYGIGGPHGIGFRVIVESEK